MKAKYIDAKRLKAEIERRKELLTPHKGQGVGLCREVIKQFDSLLSFIDIISQPIIKDDIIDEIRTEIERRFSEYNHDSNHHIQAAKCASLLDFLDTLQQEQSEGLSGEDVMTMCNQILIDWVKEGKTKEEKEQREQAHIRFFKLYDDYMMQEQPEVDLEKELEQYARNHPTDDAGSYRNLFGIARHFYELGGRLCSK